MKSLSEDIAKWLRKQVKRAHKNGVIVGLSGGIDSSCVAVLSKMALGSNVLGLILPCNSNPEDEELALKVARRFDIGTRIIPLNNIYRGLIAMCPEGNELARANLKPRLRMSLLYYFANALDYLVAGTGNKSERSVGYFTKHGDGGVDLQPLGGLLKTEVRKLAKELDIPEEIITRPPTAGLWTNQTDEGELGITYHDLDRILESMEKKRTKGIDSNKLLKIKKMIKESQHKRAGLPVFNSRNHS